MVVHTSANECLKNSGSFENNSPLVKASESDDILAVTSQAASNTSTNSTCIKMESAVANLDSDNEFSIACRSPNITNVAIVVSSSAEEDLPNIQQAASFDDTESDLHQRCGSVSSVDLNSQQFSLSDLLSL